MSKRPVVHVLGTVHPAAIERLKRDADILTETEPFPSSCDAVIVRARRITADDIAACENLKVVGKHGAGTDTIDVEAAKAAGIPVFSTPGANAESVADLAVGFALSLTRNIHEITLAMKRNESVGPHLRFGYEMSELPAGIVGMGAVGRRVLVRLSNGFGMQVDGYDPYVAETEWPDGAGRRPDLRSLAEKSRILFLHGPLTPETQGMVDAGILAAMPENSYLVNCSRGGIVDEEALAEALQSGHLAGAASDVFATEPPESDNPLMKIQGFLATPHLGASTNAGLQRVGLQIVEKVLEALDRSEHANQNNQGEMP